MSSHHEKCGAVLQTQPFPLLQQTVAAAMQSKPLMHIQDMVRYPFSPLDYELFISLFSYPENNPNNVSFFVFGSIYIKPYHSLQKPTPFLRDSMM